MTKEEADESYWDYQPVILVLDDGTSIFPMSDDEGNSAGSLYHCGGAINHTSNEVLIMNKEFTEFKSDVLKELSELIKITGDPFLMRTKRSVENDRYNNDINEYVLSEEVPQNVLTFL